MKHLRLILLATGALIALLAATAFSKVDRFAPEPGVAVRVATSSEVSMPSVAPDALAPKTPDVPAPSGGLRAKAAAAKDLGTGETLYNFHQDTRWPVASITKIMTAQIVLDRLDPQAVITLAPDDFSAAGSSLSSSLQPGDQYHASDLLKILLLPSSNEAAEAFARSYGRSAFMAAMNAKAAAWGLEDTYFADPSGLSVANQSTAGDILELVRQAYALHPEIFMITQARFAEVRELSTGTVKRFATTNNFAGRTGFLGGKTGTTPEAGENLVSIFQTSGSTVALVVFGAIDRYAATESLLQLIR